VDYESLIPFLSESIRQNFNDIKRNESETQRLHRALDALHEQFTGQHTLKDTFKRTPPMSKRRIAFYSVVIGAISVIAVAVFIMLGGMMLGSSIQPPEISEREVLKELFHATGGPYWYVSTGWMTNTSVCEWHNVECGRTEESLEFHWRAII
jgi:hypothetical protein